MLSFHVKFVQMDRQTTVEQYAPNISIWGHKKYGSAKTGGKIITFTKGINVKNCSNIVIVFVHCTFL